MGAGKSSDVINVPFGGATRVNGLIRWIIRPNVLVYAVEKNKKTFGPSLIVKFNKPESFQTFALLLGFLMKRSFVREQ